ncbi:leucine rich repeat protein windpipe [Calliopsis andreniformis]|uniref:leucine rich repeat protein windpipe n=1 Tax=Calliopsis andreniformis TaxID=337506 RepID=UPI003FCD97EE
MQTTLSLLTLFLVLVNYPGRTNGLCNLINGTEARCYELEDVKYIETYDLESLKASVMERDLLPGLFNNLSSLRHLDLSGGNLERIKPGSLHNLVNLRSLNLAENHISFLDLGSIDGLNHLHSLNLRKNNIRHLPPILVRLKVLKHLDIQGNPLECNCATLKVRDLIVKKGVKITKKISCAGPNNIKGTSLFKPDATVICNLEEQDREMQRDQGYDTLNNEYGSGDDILSKLDEEKEEDFVDEKNTQEEENKEEEKAETPFPQPVETSTTSITEATKVNATSQESTTVTEGLINSTEVTDSLEKAIDKDEEFFLDSDEKKEQTSTMTAVQKKKEFKDALFYPVEGSGDEEGSGEGSGTIYGNWKKIGEVEEDNEKEDETPSIADRILGTLFNTFWSTTEPAETKKDLDLEEEQFIDASAGKEAEEKPIVPKKVNLDEAVPSTTEMTKDTTLVSTNAVELVDSELSDMSKVGKVKAEEASVNGELTEVSPTKQSKKGMGSYVVLAALLAILATLIGFAAYKGDFCRKKRKRGDVENGTELKDMQKALLDTGNSTQPKIASNGTVENAPLVEDAVDHEGRKTLNDRQSAIDLSKSPNGTADRVDPVKPPRRTATPPDDRRISGSIEPDASSVKDGSLSARRSFVDPTVSNGPTDQSEINGPPLSPGAQRVKITLQENPDSVPRTPILITRTMAGENLVKTA